MRKQRGYVVSRSSQKEAVRKREQETLYVEGYGVQPVLRSQVLEYLDCGNEVIACPTVDVLLAEMGTMVAGIPILPLTILGSIKPKRLPVGIRVASLVDNREYLKSWLHLDLDAHALTVIANL
jgi:hypothetical protein